MRKNLKVTVFGGASPKAGEPAYENAMQLGQLLAQAGFTVMTGAYSGTMEAVSRGAADAGGHVVGMTCRNRTLAAVKATWVQEVRPSIPCKTADGPDRFLRRGMAPAGDRTWPRL